MKLLLITIVALLLLSSCSPERRTMCPNINRKYFYREAGTHSFRPFIKNNKY